ncbi:hypothetical protein HFU97_13210, partial [Acidithiobacillus sp. BN09-2]|nr:hypothetical protein [Acidithiobacillus sp. BN09-2]
RLAALMMGVDEELWPSWPDDFATEKGAWVDEGGTMVQSRHPLPVDPHIREWLLSRVTAETVQAIGRARAVNSDREITVRIFGGIPLAGLGRYGLEVSSYEDDPAELGRTHAQHNQEQANAARERFAMAAAGVVAEGRSISIRQIAAWQKAHGLPQIGSATYAKIIAEPMYQSYLHGCDTPAEDIFAAMDCLLADAAEAGIGIDYAARNWLTRANDDISEAESLAALFLGGWKGPDTGGGLAALG